MANIIPLFPLNIFFYPAFAFLDYLKHELLMTGTLIMLKEVLTNFFLLFNLVNFL